MFNHNKVSPIRKYMRSRNAHNIVNVIGKQYPRAWEAVRSSWSVVDSSSEGVVHCSMISKVYSGVDLERLIHSTAGKEEFTITDNILIADKTCNVVEILWHFDSDKRVDVIHDNLISIVSETSGTILLMEVNANVRKDFSVWKGAHEVFGYSCISKLKNKIEDVFTVKVILHADCENVEVSTRFYFA